MTRAIATGNRFDIYLRCVVPDASINFVSATIEKNDKIIKNFKWKFQIRSDGKNGKWDARVSFPIGRAKWIAMCRCAIRRTHMVTINLKFSVQFSRLLDTNEMQRAHARQ